MKKLIIPLFILKSTFLTGQIVPNPSYVQAGYNWMSGTDVQAQNSIIAGLGGYTASLTAQAEVRGVNYAAALPGYQAAGFTSNGYACLRIDPNLPCITSFHANGFDNIPKYDRFEIGVALPAVIQSQIDNFIQAGTNGPNKINPYDPDQVRIECVYSLQGSNPFQQCLRHGFYESQAVSIAAPPTDDWVMGATSEYPFRVRFAPPATGYWKGVVTVYQNNVLIYTSNDFGFTVIQSGNLGHLSMANPANTSVLKMQYSSDPSQKIFYGIGMNIDVGHGSASVQSCAALQVQNNNNYWAEQKSSPGIHLISRTAIRNLAANGGNFIRLRLTRWAFPIEEAPFCTMPTTSPYNPDPKYLNNYSANEKFMWELDSTLLTCELNDIHILLTLLYDQDFRIEGNGPDDGGGWERNPYSTMGIVRDQFFTDPNVQLIFQKRLYYIEARWGYSTSIAAWEMINETERMGADGLKLANGTWDAFLVGWDGNVASDVSNWLCVMKNYLQAGTIYPHHLVTNGGANPPPGYAGPTSSYPINWTTPSNSCLDFFTDHFYTSELQVPAANTSAPLPSQPGSYHYENSTGALQLISGYYQNYWNTNIPNCNSNTSPKKGHLFGEYGLTDPFAVPFALGNATRRSKLTFHNQLWGSLFTNGISTALQEWGSTVDPGDPYPHGNPPYINPFHEQYKPFRAFIDLIDFNTLLLPDANLGNVWWRKFGACNWPPLFQITYLDNENDFSPVQTFWMRTAGADIVYGWTKNATSNWMVDGYFPSPSFINYMLTTFYYNGTPYPASAFVPAVNNEIKVQGLLISTVYDVTVFDTWSATSNPVNLQLTTDVNGELRFGLDMPYDVPSSNTSPPTYPDYAFIAIKHSLSSRNAITINSEETTTGIVTNTTSDYETKIYPVPASDKVYLSFNTQNWLNLRVYIIDELGKVYEKLINKDTTVDVREFPNGFYTLKIKDDKHEKIFKIIIQH